MRSWQQIQGWSRLNTKILNWWRTSTEIGRGFLIGPSSSGEIYNRVITNRKTPKIDLCSATSSVRDFSGQISTSLTGPFPCSEIWGKYWKRDWSNLRCLSPREQSNKSRLRCNAWCLVPLSHCSGAHGNFQISHADSDYAISCTIPSTTFDTNLSQKSCILLLVAPVDDSTFFLCLTLATFLNIWSYYRPDRSVLILNWIRFYPLFFGLRLKDWVNQRH